MRCRLFGSSLFLKKKLCILQVSDYKYIKLPQTYSELLLASRIIISIRFLTDIRGSTWWCIQFIVMLFKRQTAAADAGKDIGCRIYRAE
jgi:hypothetical protein